MADIKHCIIHKIEKQQHKKHVELYLSENLHQNDDGSTMNLLDNLRTVFNSSTRGSGGFERDSVFKGYLANSLNEGAGDFKEFSHNSMKYYKSILEATNFATGGYIVFLDYYENNERFYIICSLKQIDGIGFKEGENDNNIKIVVNKNIDLSKLHEAARINITRFSQDKETFLSFLKVKVDHDVVEYFQKFIGCEELLVNKEQTKLLKKYVEEFIAQKDDFDADQKSETYMNVFNYLERNQKKELDLSAFSAVINPLDNKEFIKYVNKQEVSLSSGFIPVKSLYRGLGKKQYKDSDGRYNFNFNRNLIAQGIVVLDEEKQAVTIKQINKNWFKTLNQ